MKLKRLLIAVFVIICLVILAVLTFQIIEDDDDNPFLSEGIQGASNEARITLTVGLPLQTTDYERFFDAFEDEHPEVDVVGSVELPSPAGLGSAMNTESYLNNAKQYVESADVLFVYAEDVSNKLTRSQYLLDLKPLVAADSGLELNKYNSVVWQSFEWENGFWALPIGGVVVALEYNKTRFDEAGLSYPKADWQAEDFFSLLEQFAEINGSRPVLATDGYDQILLRSLLGENFHVVSNNKLNPQLTTPSAIELAQRFQQFRQQEVIVDYPTDNYEPPMWIVERPTSGNPMYETIPLPSGRTGLFARGFAVNQGTSHPELAYELAKYLSQNADLVNRYLNPFLDVFAYEPIDEIYVNDGEERFLERDALVDELAAKGLLTYENFYTEYVLQVLETTLEEQDLSLDDALAAAQENVEKDLASLTTQTVINSPTLVPSLEPGKVAITFGGIYEILDRNDPAFTLATEQFTEADPDVGRIDFVEYFDKPLTESINDLDCFFAPSNLVGQQPYQEYLLAIDPLLDADPSFKRSDVLKGTLQLLEIEGATYAFPIAILPQVISYKAELQQQYNLPLPNTTWSFNDFKLLVSELKPFAEEGQAVFAPSFVDTQYLLMLIAANGQLPYDFRSNPPTLSLTDPEVITAIRDVLDMARNDLIYYHKLQILSDRPSISSSLLKSESWIDFDARRYFFRTQNLNGEAETYQLTVFPVGASYLPLSHEIGAGYINQDTAYPEACYRWLRFLSEQGHLFLGIPARSSLIDDQRVIDVKGEEISAFYQHYVSLLNESNVILFPALYSIFSQYPSQNQFELYWIGQAFNGYVLDNQELEAGLIEAETKIEEYRQCIVESGREAANIIECATTVDSEFIP